jgi:hypothetical protein
MKTCKTLTAHQAKEKAIDPERKQAENMNLMTDNNYIN